jgi:hypothetical protein
MAVIVVVANATAAELIGQVIGDVAVEGIGGVAVVISQERQRGVDRIAVLRRLVDADDALPVVLPRRGRDEPAGAEDVAPIIQRKRPPSGDAMRRSFCQARTVSYCVCVPSVPNTLRLAV